jgi:hypothetical protein
MRGEERRQVTVLVVIQFRIGAFAIKAAKTLVGDL